jgi:hypothetical protein
MVSDRRKMAGVRRGELERFEGVLTGYRRSNNGGMRVGRERDTKGLSADL